MYIDASLFQQVATDTLTQITASTIAFFPVLIFLKPEGSIYTFPYTNTTQGYVNVGLPKLASFHKLFNIIIYGRFVGVRVGVTPC